MSEMSEMSEMTVDRETWYRVPRSAEECAVHLEAGGVVEVWRGDRWVSLEGSCVRSVDFRLFTDFRSYDYRLVYFRSYDYRLVYSTPVGMSPVIGAPARAYGVAGQEPEGWDQRGFHRDEFGDRLWTDNAIIEARPPAPAPEPRTEKVPLHEVIGRTLPHGMSCDPNPPIQKVDSDFGGWWWYPDRTTDLRTTLSVVDGLVEVLAEEEA